MMRSDVSLMRFVAFLFLVTFFGRLDKDLVPNPIQKKKWRVLLPTLMAATPVGAQILNNGLFVFCS